MGRVKIITLNFENKHIDMCYNTENIRDKLYLVGEMLRLLKEKEYESNNKLTDQQKLELIIKEASAWIEGYEVYNLDEIRKENIE